MRTIATLLGLFVFASAYGNGDTVPRVADKEVSATVARLRTGNIGPHLVVFGYLTIRGIDHALVAANLECFSLQVGASKSDSIWVDSFVDIQRGDYPAQNGTVAVAVYWPMKDFKGATAEELRNARLSIVNPFLGPCFKFSPAEKRT